MRVAQTSGASAAQRFPSSAYKIKNHWQSMVDLIILFHADKRLGMLQSSAELLYAINLLLPLDFPSFSFFFFIQNIGFAVDSLVFSCA